MPRYANRGGDSGVVAYELSDGQIEVTFHDESVYLYTTGSAGAANIEQMHALAIGGEGLNSFINTHVRKRYERTLR